MMAAFMSFKMVRVTLVIVMHYLYAMSWLRDMVWYISICYMDSIQAFTTTCKTRKRRRDWVEGAIEILLRYRVYMVYSITENALIQTLSFHNGSKDCMYRKGFACSDDHTGNYQLILKFPFSSMEHLCNPVSLK